jgi:DNA-binding transcriptional regulator YiaG
VSQEYISARVALDPEGCWVWQRSTSHGYGNARVGGKAVRAHRLAYEVFVGPIPDGMNVCHSCDNPACCNPDHLWVGSQADNMADMARKGRQRQGERQPRKPPKHEPLAPSEARALRLRMGLSRPQFARLVGVHPSTVHRWESGRRAPQGDALLALVRLQRQQEGAR